MKSFLSMSLAAGLLMLAAACGGGGGGSADPQPEPAPAADATMSSRSVIKLRSNASGSHWVALAQRARWLENQTTPDRELLLSQPAPAQPLRWSPPSGWSLIDFAWHPSGQLSVVLAEAQSLRLLRLSAQAEVLSDQPFADPLAASDPFAGVGVPPPPDASLVLRQTRDAVRLAPQGEALVMALRSWRHTVLAYGLAYQQESSSSSFTQRWRTLVEPGVAIAGVALTSGTFDPFAALNAQWQVHLDVAADGRIAVAVGIGRTDLALGHSEHFGEPIPDTVANGALVSLLGADGRRIRTTLVDSSARAEVHSLRWAGEELVLAGRIRPSIRTDGFSWDGWLAWVPASGGAPEQQVLDIDRSDALLDAVPLPGGRWLLAGVTGYWQNPGGGSISEDATPLLALLPARGQAAQRLTVPAGARHNQVRSLAGQGRRWWTGGMHNGPGTHSADADPSLLVADGFVRAVELPQG